MSKRIIKILMERDGVSEQEARITVRETRDEINSVIEQLGGLEEVEGIIECNLGLEPDYVEDFLF